MSRYHFVSTYNGSPSCDTGRRFFRVDFFEANIMYNILKNISSVSVQPGSSWEKVSLIIIVYFLRKDCKMFVLEIL